MNPLLRSISVALLLVASVPMSGCGAVYPELGTSMSPMPAGVPVEPPPPEGRYYFEVVRAVMPSRTRDGRDWVQAFGSPPDPYVKVFLEDKELWRTSSVRDSMEPSFEGSPSGNVDIVLGSELRIELWDAGALHDHPIGVKKLRVQAEMIDAAEQAIELPAGGTVYLKLAPARPVWGVGLWYDLRKSSAKLTRVLDGSPAWRAGLRKGDRILAIDGQSTDALGADDIRSRLNAIPAAGLKLDVQHADGSTLQAVLKEGPMYIRRDEASFLPKDLR
jgi:hypothetical protein